MVDLRANWLPTTRCRGNRARGSREQIFFVREPRLCVGHTLMGTLVCLARLMFASETRRAERPHALSMVV